MEQKPHKPANHHQRERLSLGIPNNACHQQEPRHETTSSSMPDLLPQWGNRKRLRFTKNSKATGDEPSSPVQKTTNPRFDRKSVVDKDRSDSKRQSTAGYFNLRQRPSSQAQPTNQRALRNSEIMRLQTNGGGGDQEKKKHQHQHPYKHHHNSNENGGGSSDLDAKKIGVGGGSSSGSDAVPAVWPHKFVIALTNKEKEEDFMAIKGTKLPQRPKKRSKQIQRTLNAVSPGAWLCDLTLDRYEVKEKKSSKKTRRGLKGMGNKSSDSD